MVEEYLNKGQGEPEVYISKLSMTILQHSVTSFFCQYSRTTSVWIPIFTPPSYRMQLA